MTQPHAVRNVAVYQYALGYARGQQMAGIGADQDRAEFAAWFTERPGADASNISDAWQAWCEAP